MIILTLNGDNELPRSTKRALCLVLSSVLVHTENENVKPRAIKI